MHRSLLFTTVLASALVANAQLAPQQPASLRDHLIEVNAEWKTHAADVANTDRQVSFANDTERIAQHLHLVRAHLSASTPEGLTATQAEYRKALLMDLERYANTGRFPQNHVLPFRNPIFIDPTNTACAVGQLIIESGDRALADRISSEMNQFYIRDMHWPEIGAWADANGFTGEELAWIQPGYSPSIPWAALGDGTNGTVSELLRLADGNMVVAGEFTEANGAVRTHVALWNGADYLDMGSLPDGNVNTAIEFGGDVWIGGSFNGGTTDLLRWDNGQWVPSAAFSSKYAEVHALHEHNGALYASGGRSGFAGIDYLVQRLVNGDWEPVGQVLNGPINSLETFDGTLYCGGNFTDNFLSQTNTILHIARLNSNVWQQAGNGLDGSVYDLLVHQDQLYAAGDMVSELSTYFGLSRIATEALTWEPLMPNIGNYIFSPVDALVRVNAMVEHDGLIFLAGTFFAGQGMVNGDGLAVFSGTADDVQPYCAFNGPVNDLELMGDRLVLGGTSTAYANIAATDLTTGIGERVERLTLSVSPNPTTDLVTVQLPSSLSGAATLRIIDAAGRLVDSPAQRNGDLMRFSTHGLASGNYQLEVSNGTTSATGRFVKE